MLRCIPLSDVVSLAPVVAAIPDLDGCDEVVVVSVMSMLIQISMVGVPLVPGKLRLIFVLPEAQTL